MIEAVNSAVASSSVLSPQDGGANPTAQTEKAASGKVATSSVNNTPEVPYISPHIEVDVNYDKAVLQIRDSSTGDVLRQFPSESRLQEIRREAAAQQRTEVAQTGSSSEEVSDTSSSGETGGVSFDLSSVSDVEPTATPSSGAAALEVAQSAAASLSGGQSGSLSSGVSFLA